MAHSRRLNRRYAALSLRTLVFSIFFEAFDINGTNCESSLMHVFNLFRRCFSARFRICLLELNSKKKNYIHTPHLHNDNIL